MAATKIVPKEGVEALKGCLIPLGNGGKQPDQLSWRQHSASPTSRCPHRLLRTQSGIRELRIIPCAKPVHQVADGRIVDID